tara:strand:+ start:114 stop:413 length:300 start_codon:yes stop_codon:yes gene_type:complete
MNYCSKRIQATAKAAPWRLAYTRLYHGGSNKFFLGSTFICATTNPATTNPATAKPTTSHTVGYSGAATTAAHSNTTTMISLHVILVVVHFSYMLGKYRF